MSELVAPVLHRGDEIGFFLSRTVALDHAFDNGAEGGLKEPEDVINPDVRGRMQLLPEIGVIGIGEPPHVKGFPFDITDHVAIPQHQGMSDAPPLAVLIRVGLPFLDLPRLLIRKVLEDLRDVVAEREHHPHGRTELPRQAEKPVQELNCVERSLVSPKRLWRHKPRRRTAVIRRGAPYVGVVTGIPDTIVKDVRAWIVLPLGIYRDERTVIVLCPRLFLLGFDLVRAFAASFSGPLTF